MKLIETIQIVKAAGELSLLLGKNGRVYISASPVHESIKDDYRVSFALYYDMLTLDTNSTMYAHEAIEILKELKQIANECEKFKE